MRQRTSKGATYHDESARDIVLPEIGRAFGRIRVAGQPIPAGENGTGALQEFAGIGLRQLIAVESSGCVEWWRRTIQLDVAKW